MSKRSCSAGSKVSEAFAARSVEEPLGPPGLMNKLPIRFFGLVARERSRAISVVAPLGLS